MTEPRGAYGRHEQPDRPRRVERIGVILDRLLRQQPWGTPPPHLAPDRADRPVQTRSSRHHG